MTEVDVHALFLIVCGDTVLVLTRGKREDKQMYSSYKTR